MKIIVYHSEYGCDTGCCGHTIEIQDDRGDEVESKFLFDHPYERDYLQFAKDLVREAYGEDHVADLDWKNCVISDQ
jgi:hypothetical protein